MSLCFTKKNSAVTDDTSHGEIVVSTEGLCPGHVWYYSLPFWLPTYGRWIFSKNSNFQPICKNFKFYIFLFCYLIHGLWFYQLETCTNETGVLNFFKKSFLAAIAALYVTMSVCRMVGWSDGRMVGLCQRVSKLAQHA